MYITFIINYYFFRCSYYYHFIRYHQYYYHYYLLYYDHPYLFRKLRGNFQREIYAELIIISRPPLAMHYLSFAILPLTFATIFMCYSLPLLSLSLLFLSLSLSLLLSFFSARLKGRVSLPGHYGPPACSTGC